MTSNPNKKRPWRRLRQRWIGRVTKDLEEISETTRIVDAEDRDRWRTLVETAKRLNGL